MRVVTLTECGVGLKVSVMVEVTGTKGVGFSTGDTMIGVGRSGVEMASSLRVNVALTS